MRELESGSARWILPQAERLTREVDDGRFVVHGVVLGRRQVEATGMHPQAFSNAYVRLPSGRLMTYLTWEEDAFLLVVREYREGAPVPVEPAEVSEMRS